VCALVVGVLAGATPAAAQPVAPVATVGLLCVGACPAPPLDAGMPMFVSTLREAGYVDGRNMVLDSRGIGDTVGQLPVLATGLVRRRVDVVVAIGVPAVLAAKRASATVPVVMLDVPNKERVPVIAWSRAFAAGGALMSYGPARAEMHRLAATTVAKILQGKRPADIPVEQPTRYELVVNLATAKAVGVAIPPSRLARADEVIQ
jgi:ABC-type uncharacterized transport system substrate-binding protein